MFCNYRMLCRKTFYGMQYEMFVSNFKIWVVKHSMRQLVNHCFIINQPFLYNVCTEMYLSNYCIQYSFPKVSFQFHFYNMCVLKLDWLLLKKRISCIIAPNILFFYYIAQNIIFEFQFVQLYDVWVLCIWHNGGHFLSVNKNSKSRFLSCWICVMYVVKYYPILYRIAADPLFPAGVSILF